MNKKISLSVAICLAASSSAYATNGYQLIGIGAYQKSLGGAVTAKPGSAMTAISNPAGMARVGKRADFSLEMFMPERFVDFTASGGEKNDSKSEQYGVPALGWTAPIEDGSDIYFGGGIYGTSGLGTDYPETQFTGPGGGNLYFQGYSAIQFWQMAPTIAWHHNEQLTFGVSLNIDYQSVSFKQAYSADTSSGGSGDFNVTNFDLSRTAQAFGYGLSFGVLYDINDDLTVGATYKSKQDFSDLEYQLAQGDIQDATGQLVNAASGCQAGATIAGVGVMQTCQSGTYSLELDFPAMYSVGLAYQVNKFTNISFDAKVIEWSKTLDALTIMGPNGEVITLNSNWDDQTILAVGVEVAVNYALNLRAGYNYSDAPFDESSTDSNYILPAVTQSHFAFGADYRLNKYWELGMHASKALEETYTSPVTAAKIGLGITTFGINLGYLF